MTLHEQTLAALSKLPPSRAENLIAQANEWLYERRSKNLDYGVRVEKRIYHDEDRIALARKAFLTRVLASALHDLKRDAP